MKSFAPGNNHAPRIVVAKPELAPFVVSPLAIFTPQELAGHLGLTKSTLAREFRNKRLRVAKRAGRAFILGQWVIEWLESGEVRAGEEN
jgi:hypothetical protein